MHQAQETRNPPFQIDLVPPGAQEVAKFVVWRTDYYICTGIRYARSLGRTVEDFTSFLGTSHSWEDMRGQGLGPPVRLLHFVIMSYPGGEFTLTSQAENAVSIRCNRPYAHYFETGTMLGVSLEEFETALWGHISILAERIGLHLYSRIEGDRVVLDLST